MSWPVPPHGFLGSQASTAATDNDTYQISRSLRFNSADSAYLSRTPNSASTSNQKCTFSFWWKRASLLTGAAGSEQWLFSSSSAAGSTNLGFYIAAANKLNIEYFGSNYLIPTQVFRDPSAWYHIVLSIDTTQVTASNRAKYYVNGVQITQFSTENYPNQYAPFDWMQNGQSCKIGDVHSSGRHLDAYLTEFNFIDGQALTPSSFGETDATTGRWKAKAFSGNYGTNGFYLNFADNSGATATTLGKDSAPISGAHTTANNWTPNNLSVTPGAGNDSLTDSPSNYGAISTTLVNDTYQISKSLRFNSADSAYLNRTPSVAGNRKTWTWSGWVKRGTLGGNNVFMGNTDASGYNGLYFQFDTNNNITIGDYGVGSYVWVLTTSQVFRDTSSWHHIVATYDSTQVTASDRVSVYINGTKITAFSTATYPSLNLDGRINSTQLTSIGRLGSYNGFYFEGYLAEVNFVDGQALTPTSFGTRDINTYLWKPKAYTGTYGTNGFYLNFSDSSNTTAATLGKDQAGSNNWTPNNFSVSAGPGNDSLTDSPTYYGTDTGVGGEARGDYATLNPLVSAHTYSNGNLDVVLSTTGVTSIPSTVSTLGVSSGKWYFEFTPTALNAGCLIGITATPASNVYPGGNSSSYGYYSADGNKFNSASGTAYGNSFTVNDIIGIAFDIDGGKIWFAKNGTWQASGNPASGTNAAFTSIASGTYFSSMHKDTAGAANASGTFNFGQRPFIHAAPFGFRALRDYNKLPTPTGGEVRGNYCTLNFIDKDSSATLSNGNLDIVSSVADWADARGTMSMPSGKWYFEARRTGTANIMVGIASSVAAGTLNTGTYLYQSPTGYFYFSTGDKYNNNTSSTYGSAIAQNDYIGVAFDADARTLVFYKNGVSQGTAYTVTSGYEYMPAVISYTGSGQIETNFGQRPWAYDAPFGFLPLCTTLLPQPIVQKPSSYFDAVTYTGNGASRSITSLGFSPDLVWLKERDDTEDHFLFDKIRGANNYIRSNLTNAEGTISNYLTAFNSNGFSLGDGGGINGTGDQYVAWAWDESPIAGMDIVSYTGTGAARTVPHNLGVPPKMIIIKGRTNAYNWNVYHAGLLSPTNNKLYLDDTAQENNGGTNAGTWNSTAPTSSVFSLGTFLNVNENLKDFIAYCFAEIEGFSKFGSYTGNGLADGPFVYCGFRPRYIMYKRTDAAGNWNIVDTARDTYNPEQTLLRANLPLGDESNAVYTQDFLANGWKIRSTNVDINVSTATYIFAAFAESPFKYSRAR